MAQNALNGTLLSSAPRTTGSNVFPPTPPTPPNPPAPQNTNHKGLIIGLVSAFVVLLICIVVAWICCKKKKSSKILEPQDVIYGPNGTDTG